MTSSKSKTRVFIVLFSILFALMSLAYLSTSYSYADDLGDDPTVGGDPTTGGDDAEEEEPEVSDPGLVEASGQRDRTDIDHIERAMAVSNTITLQSGKTYYLKWPIHIVSNKTINAAGATIICEKGALDQYQLKSANFSNIKNVTINGGTWKYTSASGYKGTSFGFVHGQNLKLKNMTIQHASYDGHAVEFVACKNVLMDGVKVIPLGTKRKSEESMVQIDVATKATYPRLKENPKLANGACCQNVTIQNCTISGNRALATGYAYKDKKFVNKYHTNIKVLNNKLTSWNGEGFFLVNTKKATITGNTIISKCTKKSKNQSVGLHILQVGKVKKSKFVIKNNTIKGGLHAIRAWSMKKKAKIAKVTIKKNKFYCKKGKKKAIEINKKGTKKVVSSKNKKYKW